MEEIATMSQWSLSSTCPRDPPHTHAYARSGGVEALQKTKLLLRWRGLARGGITVCDPRARGVTVCGSQD
eukprot:1515532-Rhodomonas_salina.2